MEKGRLEAFSDGVIAVIITIMVLELHVPQGSQWGDLLPLYPKFICYLLSFINVGLFWMSLIPVTTDWMGENHFAQTPVIFYGMVLLMCGVSYYFLVNALIARHGKDSLLAQAIGRDKKGKLSVVLYAVAIGAGCINAWIALVIYLFVAAMWFIPDTRFEYILNEKNKP